MSYRKRGPIAALASVQEVMRARPDEAPRIHGSPAAVGGIAHGGPCNRALTAVWPLAAAAPPRYSSGESSSASCASKGKPFADPSGRTSRGTTGGHCT
jgi:hypothetical protein